MPSRQVLRRDETVDAARLTEVLHEAGVLTAGVVADVEVRSNSAFTSLVVHLDVTYSSDASADAPRFLILKRMDRGWGELEVAFYRATSPGEPPLVRCHDAAFDPRDGASHLLLDDVSVTHRLAVTRDDLLSGRGVPEGIDGIMSALATFHARRWEDVRIGGAPFLVRGWFADDAGLRAHVTRREGELAALREVPDAAAYVQFYTDAVAALPTLWDRYLRDRIAQRRALTVTHGDCYLTQWLTPRAAAGDTSLIDFDSVSANIAAFDLVFLMASFWSGAQRAEHEERCLQIYHEALQSNGVARYSWEDLLLDYRLMLAFVVFDPVFDLANGSPATYWKPKMECLTTAYREWGCSAL